MIVNKVSSGLWKPQAMATGPLRILSLKFSPEALEGMRRIAERLSKFNYAGPA